MEVQAFPVFVEISIGGDGVGNLSAAGQMSVLVLVLLNNRRKHVQSGKQCPENMLLLFKLEQCHSRVRRTSAYS